MKNTILKKLSNKLYYFINVWWHYMLSLDYENHKKTKKKMNHIIINCQYLENYGAHDWDGNNKCPEHWKPKGGYQFSMDIDADLLMYAKEDCIKVFKQMLKEESNDYEAFEYIDYDIQWSEPTKLDSNKFLKSLTSLQEQITK